MAGGSGNFVNLNEQGLLSQTGQHYDTTAQDGSAESRSFSGRMEASRAYLRGSAGTTFTGVAATHSANLGALAAQIAEQAYRAVRAEQSVVAADDDATTTQASTRQQVEGLSTQAYQSINP